MIRQWMALKYRCYESELNLNYSYGTFWRGIVSWSREGEIDLKSDKGDVVAGNLNMPMTNMQAAERTASISASGTIWLNSRQGLSAL